jgi:catechol-2,3-dioxygenase
MSNMIGPSFLAFQVRDIEKSKSFYTDIVGLDIDPHGPDHAYVFKTTQSRLLSENHSWISVKFRNLDGVYRHGFKRQILMDFARNSRRTTYQSSLKHSLVLSVDSLHLLTQMAIQ